MLSSLRIGSVIALSFLLLCRADAEDRRYLYLSSPDAAQNAGHSGNGILIFDIDNGHKFVRRIEIPMFKEGIRGMTANAKNRCIYYSTTNHGLGCFDLTTEKVVWEKHFEVGCDRSSVTPDGTKIYVPTGWWYTGEDGGFLVIDAKTGELLQRIKAGPKAHNSIVSLDGKFAFLGTDNAFSVFNAKDGSLIWQTKPVGEYGVFPFTVDSRNRYAFVCLGKHVGFDVVDLKTGEVPHRVLAGESPIPHRTHGAALTPDESELWISDQDGKKLFIFDATVMPPKPTGHVELSEGGHGWVCFSLDGKFAWCHTPDVFDAKTRQKVAILKDENGNAVSSSKFVEVQFRDGQVVNVGSEFGVGRANAPKD